jgi:hypothetical protein
MKASKIHLAKIRQGEYVARKESDLWAKYINNKNIICESGKGVTLDRQEVNKEVLKIFNEVFPNESEEDYK